MLGWSSVVTATAAGARAAAGFSTAEEAELAVHAKDGASITVALHTGLTYGWLVFAVLAGIAALPLLVSGTGRPFAAGLCYSLGLPLLLFGIGAPAPVPLVRTLTWVACAAVLVLACFVMLTSGPVPDQRQVSAAAARRRPRRHAR